MGCARIPLTVVGIITGLLLVFLLLTQPSNERDWRADQATLPYVEFDGELVHVYNIRNFTYTNTEEYAIVHYNRTYRLSELENVYFIVEPIADWQGAAHTFYSFRFGEQYLAVSVEARKEQGEEYSLLRGLLRRFELMYVFGDEQDLVYLRAVHRDHPVYLYPINTTPERARLLFLDVAKRANGLRDDPEFYNTLTNTCTTNLVAHANAIVPGRIPMSYKVLAPGYSDEFAYELGLIDASMPLEELRRAHDIAPKARSYTEGDFSAWIRS